MSGRLTISDRMHSARIIPGSDRAAADHAPGLAKHEHVAVSSTLKASTVTIARRRELDGGDDIALARISRERDRAALRFAKDRDLGQLEATTARLDAEARAAVVRPSRNPDRRRGTRLPGVATGPVGEDLGRL